MAEAKKTATRRGFVMPKTAGDPTPPKVVKVELPGRMARVLDVVAGANGVQAADVIREALRRVLRVELAAAAREERAGKTAS